MSDISISKIKKHVDRYFLSSDILEEKTMYQFFKKEIKTKDIKLSHTDSSVIGRTKKTRKYICGVWRVQNYHKTIPWIRIGVADDNSSASLEMVLPIFHGDMPELWSKGRNYFRLGIEYTISKHGPILQMFTNPIDINDTSEVIDIITVFHRKIQAYGQR